MSTREAAGAAPALKTLIDTERSLRSRLAHVALLTGSLMMTAVVASLWATEPALPARTRWAFAAMVGIGLVWAAFAAWVLGTRRVLLGRDSVIAGRMAVTFSSLFALGSAAAAATTGGPAAYGVLATGVVMLAVAVALLLRARRRVERLTARRQELERRLGGGR